MTTLAPRRTPRLGETCIGCGGAPWAFQLDARRQPIWFCFGCGLLLMSRDHKRLRREVFIERQRVVSAVATHNERVLRGEA